MDEKMIALSDVDCGMTCRLYIDERRGGDRIRVMVDIPREASWGSLAERFKDMAAQCEEAAKRRGEK